MDEITSLIKKNGDTLDASEWNKLVSAINYIIDFYNHYPTKLSEFENDIVDLFIGPKGDKGDTGPQGIQGPVGPKGDQGPQGVLGPKGADGIMTFEDLTEEQRESLRGPLGIQGPQGPLGILGIQGIQGEQGPAGKDGQDGSDGHSPIITVSKSGSTTTLYIDGTVAATIEDGLDGQDGLSGTNGTNGTTPHIDSTTGNWFIGTTNTGVHAQGPAGQNGSNGSNGQDGHTPVITASKSNGVTTITVDGTNIATINDGQNGSDGTDGTNGTNGNDGTDGITPTVVVTSISNGHNVAFSYGVGDSRNIDFDVMDGNDANQLQVDWNLTDNTQADYIKNKPTIPIVPSNETAASGGTTLSVVTTGEKYTWNNKASIWRGTQAQYDLLTPDDNTIYIITSAS